ncbi:nicotinamide riboside transporter PnuC [Dyella sp. A6]|uniref:nicotinamide riboside transporter PnuC n=1 Tax=Dyella aluminiiresistens TaxID=3069105 RepID=UPI002E776DF2|nr:nicotinamide riboside transporter PnuC [Dyella sp. A6]
MDWPELIGALLSVWGVWLTAQRRMLSWPVNVVACAVYGWVFLDARLYSDTLLQLTFAIFIAYGWYRWKQNLGRDRRVRVARLQPTHALLNLGVGAVGALCLGYVMHAWTDAALPWLDSALTAFSLVAQWWQDRRHCAAWWLWIILDAIYVGEYIYKQLLITSALYAGFVVLAIIGLRAWRQAEHDEMPALATEAQR